MYDTSRRIEATASQPAEAGSFVSTIIPDSFMLGGLTITVVRDDTLANSRKLLGEARYNDQEIRLDTSAARKQTVEQAFYHELVHWILYVMNEDELRNNEKFVDVFSHFLYQALVTARRETELTVDVPF